MSAFQTWARWGFAGICGLLWTASWGSAQEDLADTIARCEQSVVRIEVHGRDGDSLGSGFVVTPEGTFVTNVHVLAGAERAVAIFPDGRTFEITGTRVVQEHRDICVAQLDASGLTPLPLAAALPRKGEQVVALGSPHGLSFSATRGIVSAIREESFAREQLGRPNLEGTWIQVDAALSGGNSGGPLINVRGEVVAMSTLASQGEAQNLNFGISVVDIRAAVERAAPQPLVALREGVGKIDMEEVRPESAELIARSEIPQGALEQYVARGRAEYGDLARGLRKLAAESESRLREMEKGETYIPGGSGNTEVAVLKGRGADKYFFADESVKRREVARQQSRASALREVKQKLKTTPDDDAIYALLWNGGPRLDPRQAHSVGFLDLGVVLHSYNEHDIIIDFDNAPYLMWVKSTAGLAEGQEVTPGPVYVAGTRTVEIPGRGSMSLTILNSVMETELQKAVFGAPHGGRSGRVSHVDRLQRPVPSRGEGGRIRRDEGRVGKTRRRPRGGPAGQALSKRCAAVEEVDPPADAPRLGTDGSGVIE